MAQNITKKELMDIIEQLRASNTALQNALAQATAQPKGTRTQAPEEPKVAFKKRNGEVKMVSKAQADAWTAARDAADERKATYDARRKAFTSAACPKALEDAIRKNRAAVTAQVARSLGFVGTKQDLKALKEQILG